MMQNWLDNKVDFILKQLEVQTLDEGLKFFDEKKLILI